MNKFVFENELCKFYENDMTKYLNEYCVRKTVNDTDPLEDCCVFLAEHKSNGAKTYVLYHNETPMYACTQLEARATHIDILRCKNTK